MGFFLRSLFEGELCSRNGFGILGKGRSKTFRHGVTFFPLFGYEGEFVTRQEILGNDWDLGRRS